MFSTAVAALSSAELTKIVQPVLEVCKYLVPVMLSVVGSLGLIWCILLGVKYAKAEDPQEHEKAKKALKNAIIGFVLIFILLIMCQSGVTVFTSWWANYSY